MIKIHDVFIGLGTGEGGGSKASIHHQGVWLIVWLKIHDVFVGLGTGDMFTAKSLLGEGGGSKSLTHHQGVWLIVWLKIHGVFIGLGTGDTFTPKVPKVNNRHASKAAKRLQGLCV